MSNPAQSTAPCWHITYPELWTRRGIPPPDPSNCWRCQSQAAQRAPSPERPSALTTNTNTDTNDNLCNLSDSHPESESNPDSEIEYPCRCPLCSAGGPSQRVESMLFTGTTTSYAEGMNAALELMSDAGAGAEAEKDAGYDSLYDNSDFWDVPTTTDSEVEADHLVDSDSEFDTFDPLGSSFPDMPIRPASGMTFDTEPQSPPPVPPRPQRRNRTSSSQDKGNDNDNDNNNDSSTLPVQGSMPLSPPDVHIQTMEVLRRPARVRADKNPRNVMQ